MFAGDVITAPIVGSILSGYITSKIGGYESEHALPIAIFVGIFSIAFAMPCPFLDDITTFAIIMWLYLFTGCFIMPILTGVMLNSVEPLQRP